jgi:hypothetical protein
MFSESTHVFSVNKDNNSANFADGGIITTQDKGTTHFADKIKHQVTSYVMVYKATRHCIANSHAQTLLRS